MMRRRFAVLLTLAALAACAGVDTTAPAHRAPTAARANSAPSGAQLHDGHVIPGAIGQAGTAPASDATRLACDVPSTLTNSAVIGAKGGELDIGPHRLIIPPGALTHDTLISGTIPAGSSIEIHFEPHGLQFLKPAGLQLDVSSCSNVPDVVYLDETEGTVLERIKAVFSNWWHTVAAPLDHFSTYAMDV
ncbi:MAG TPA: hypothetical protein VHB25_03755 [Gemmatimonadaceae bacterium]|nr:hypothetical protein [Gemmatimonadaceae bacterium]